MAVQRAHRFVLCGGEQTPSAETRTIRN